MANNMESESLKLENIIIKAIEAGELLPGEKLYSERALAEKYGVSRMTVQYAMRSLVNKGYLHRERGSGTYVKQHEIDKMDLSYLSEVGNCSISAIMKNYGVKLSSKVLAKGKVKSRFISHKLELEESGEIYALHRIRYGNDEPIAVEYTYVPADIFEDIGEMDFSRVSLYDYMNSKGHMPVKFSQKLQILDVGEREQAYLKLSEKEPVYYLEFIGSDSLGKMVEYTESYVRCDKFIFKFENKAKK